MEIRYEARNKIYLHVSEDFIPSEKIKIKRQKKLDIDS